MYVVQNKDGLYVTRSGLSNEPWQALQFFTWAGASDFGRLLSFKTNVTFHKV